MIVYTLVFFIFSIHKHFVRYTNIESIVKLIKAFALYSLITILLFFLNYKSLNITLLLNQFTLFFLFCLLLRVFFSIYFSSNKKNFKTINILVYGAGSAGLNLFQNILKNSQYNLIAFVDDDVSKKNRYISDIPIISYNDIESYKKIFLLKK